MLFQNVEQLVGNTPLLELVRIEESLGLKAKLFVKLEMFNPAGSAKDRIALRMIEDAEKEGRIKPGDIIIEPTSGNTGIGLASIGGAKGYRVIIVMPDSMSVERIKLMKAYGAEIVLSDGKRGMTAAVEKAEELCAKYSKECGCIIAGQFNNPSNWKAHYSTTGPEIAADLNNKVDCFIAGIGTGGSITGCGKYLKEKLGTHIVAIEPADSPLLSEGHAGPHGIQGIGANFIPEVLDQDAFDEIVCIELNDSINTLKLLGAKEGIFVGISSGAALFEAIRRAKLDCNSGKNIVAFLPDGGDRYLSTLDL